MEPSRDFVFHINWQRTFPVIDYAEGVYLYDKDGKRYLDAAGGVHVSSIGHGVAEVVQAMAEQARKCAFAFNVHFTTEPQMRLAERLIEVGPAGMAKVYFVSGGSEANEVALQVARQYFVQRGKTSKYRFVARWHSYHGSTMGALSMTGHATRRLDYTPYLANFPHIVPCNCYRCPYDKEYPGCGIACAYDLERVIKREGADTIAAFIAEPVVGTTAGAVAPPPEYFPIIREICDRYDVLLVADEVITGCGRTGHYFGMQHWDVTPDIMTVGKGLSAGYSPLGAVMLHEKVWNVFAGSSPRPSFFIGYTYSGNPVSCAAGLAVQDYIARHDLVKRSSEIGAYLRQRMAETLGRRPVVGDVRGLGTLLAVEFVKDKATKEPFPRDKRVAETVVNTAFAKGLMLIPGGGTVDGLLGDHVLVTPPFTISESEADLIVQILEETLVEVEAKLGLRA